MTNVARSILKDFGWLTSKQGWSADDWHRRWRKDLYQQQQLRERDLKLSGGGEDLQIRLPLWMNELDRLTSAVFSFGVVLQALSTLKNQGSGGRQPC